MELLAGLHAALLARIGPFGPVLLLGALGLLLVLLALIPLLRQRSDPLDRLRKTLRHEAEDSSPSSHRLRQSGNIEQLDKFATFLEPKSEAELDSARLDMVRAGYRSKSAVRIFHAAQFVIGIGALMLGLLYAFLSSRQGQTTPLHMALSVLVPGGAGYYLPRYWVERRRQTRKQEIVNGFPDALDLMLVCVEAGQSLDQSILRVAREIRPAFPDLADEFEIVGQEVKAGKDRATVLRDMAQRTDVADIGSFVTVMIQSSSFGTSIADALRVYAAEMRDKRVMRAEEAANKLPTKLTLGTMLFTLPPLLIILIGPSIYDISVMMSKMNK